MSVRVSLPQPLAKGKRATLVFVYGGKLTGDEESPVFGIKFAAIHPTYAYLMYPARWFPVNDYSADRFTADLKVTVPAGFRVVGDGQFRNPGFPGSIAVVRGEPNNIGN